MTSDDLNKIAPNLYGDRWRAALAAFLAVDVRTVQRWANGTRDIPPGVADQIERMHAQAKAVRRAGAS